MLRVLSDQEAKELNIKAFKSLRRGSLFSHARGAGDVRYCLVWGKPDIFDRALIVELNSENIEKIFQGIVPRVQSVARGELVCINVLSL